MRKFAAFALAASIITVAGGCSVLQQDFVIADDDFGATLCMDTGDGVDEVVTGLPFLVPADNTDPVQVGFATLVNPVNIELVDAFIVRDGSMTGGMVLPENIDESFEPAEGAMLPPDEGEFSLAVQVRTLDPDAPATFDAVRLTYTDDDATAYTTDRASDFTLTPDCLEATP